MRTVSIIGPGRAGGALAIALARKGYTIENLVSQNRQKAALLAEITGAVVLPAGDYFEISSEIVLITTQDSAIKDVASDLAAALTSTPTVFHTSGSLSSEILASLADAGCKTGSMHPLVSISDPELGADRFSGSFFCVEGVPEATDIACRIVDDLGGQSFTIETRFKALYHAAAVMSAGHVTALLDAAFEAMSKCGVTSDDARKVLLPLVRSTVENLAVQPPANALTGTFARADSATFERHLAAFEDNGLGEVEEIYLQLAVRSLHLAERNGVDREQVEALREKVLMAKSRSRC